MELCFGIGAASAASGLQSACKKACGKVIFSYSFISHIDLSQCALIAFGYKRCHGAAKPPYIYDRADQV